MKEHEEVEHLKRLPRVGQIVKSKKYGTLWRVMEKREVWQSADIDRLVPGIYLSYWRIREGTMPGVGKLLGYIYTAYDNTFEANWEIVK
ncbi:MAG TPA: hypothetical protein VEI46_04825 [Thermodesulfovibrionales bacterium]|nr:hypothetical protein [Thermodesulfovibrionales bacterium]